MDKKFFEIAKHKKRLAIIDSKVGNLYYSDLFEMSLKLNINNSNEKKLVFLICKNNFETIAGYISFLRSKACILLLSQNISKSELKAMTDLYQPNYIYGPSKIKNIIPNSKTKTSLETYTLLELKLNKKFIINKNLALLLTTSGSVGDPQVVRQSYENIISNSNAICASLKIKKNDKAITTLPMNYTYGLSIINSHLLKGGSLVLTDSSIITREFWDLFKKNKVTTFGGVPYTFEILKKIKFENMKLPSLKYITQAGGKLDQNLINHFYKICKIKKFKFIIMYGQTEASPRMSYLKWEELKKYKESIGQPIPGGKFYLINEDGKKIIKNYTSGELAYSGDNVCLGYANNRSDLSKGDENKKFLNTGDIAYRNNQGFYYIVGRKKRFIKLYGHRINLDTVEKIIENTGYSCACTGNDKNINIFLNNKNKNIMKKIKSTINIKIPLIKKCYKIIFINKIPRSENGKILYSQLK